jgi:hypothetical protein
MYFKPAVAAPGGNILSTLPVPLGSWGVESGTSMATPFVAGSAALILQAKGKSASVAKSLRDLFQATASPVGSSPTDSDPLQTLAQQGAGLIQVNNAVNTKTIISPAQLLLNDTAHMKPMYVPYAGCLAHCDKLISRNRQTFTITNTGSKAASYKLSHVPAGTALTIEPVRSRGITSGMMAIDLHTSGREPSSLRMVP